MRLFPWLSDRLSDRVQDNASLRLSPQTTDSLCKALRADSVDTARASHILVKADIGSSELLSLYRKIRPYKRVVFMQDLVNSLLLCETIYKVHDLGPKAAVSKLRDMQEDFPAGVSDIQKVQCSLAHVHHRCLCFRMLD